MYYCSGRTKAHGIREDLFHMDNCTCFAADMWYYYMAEQSDHIRCYLEANKLMKAYWNSSYGLLLEFPSGLSSGILRDVRWPYMNDYDIKESEKRVKNRIRIHRFRRRKHLLLLYKRKK